MKSLFNQPENQEIIERINQLTVSTNSQWGKMNVAQMLTHVQGPLKVAFGEVKLKRSFIGILFGGIAKKKLTGLAPIQKNLPTDKNFIVKGQPNFEAEKKHLIELIQRFEKSGAEGLSQFGV